MQVKESVNASNLIQIANQMGNANNAQTADTGTSFSDCLVKAATGYAGVETQQTDRKNAEPSATTNRTDVDKTKPEAKDQRPEEQMTKPAETTDPAEKSVVQDTESDKTAAVEDAVEVVNTIGTAFAQILSSLMEQFQLSKEQLADQLDRFGMELGDLQSQDGLMQFFMNMHQADQTDLLVDEDLASALQDFMEPLQDSLSLIQNAQADPELTASFMEELAKQFLPDEVQTGLPDATETVDMTEDTVRTDVQTDVEPVQEPTVVISRSETSGNQEEQHFAGSDTTQDNTLETETKTESVSKTDPYFKNPILQAIQDAVSDVISETDSVQEMPQTTDIVEQVVEQVRLHLSEQHTSMELQLYPEHLGRIQIQVVSKDGVMTAKIAAETEAARQAIEGGLSNLKEALNSQELKVEAVEVTISTTGFEQQYEQEESSKNMEQSGSRRSRMLFTEEDEPQEEDAELERMRATGSSVSYSV